MPLSCTVFETLPLFSLKSENLAVLQTGYESYNYKPHMIWYSLVSTFKPIHAIFFEAQDLESFQTDFETHSRELGIAQFETAHITSY